MRYSEVNTQKHVEHHSVHLEITCAATARFLAELFARGSLLPSPLCCSLYSWCWLEICKTMHPRPLADGLPAAKGSPGEAGRREIGLPSCFPLSANSTRAAADGGSSLHLLSSLALASPAPSRHQRLGAELQAVLTLPCVDWITKDTGKNWIKSDIHS